MRVFLTGGTGYVGSRILQDLLSTGHEVSALVRPGSESKLPVNSDEITVVHGDILDKSSFSEALSQCDAAIHLIGIIREFPGKGITFEKFHVQATQNVLDAARENNIGRYVHMSALGARIDSPSGYFATKARAQELVVSSGLDYTIFKPSIIYGENDDFINYFAGIIKTFHVIPIIGKGTYRMQPISVKDVSQLFTQALTNSSAIGKTYEVAGPDRYEYKEMMQIVKSAIGTWAIPVHTPRAIMSPMAKLFQHLRFFPVTNDQIIMLYDENITDDTRIFEDFDIEPTPFREGIEAYL